MPIGSGPALPSRDAGSVPAIRVAADVDAEDHPAELSGRHSKTLETNLSTSRLRISVAVSGESPDHV